MTAALGVILDHENNTQVHFGGGETSEDKRRARAGERVCHNDDILGLAISPDRTWAVTGQRGNIPLIFTWDAETGKQKSRAVLAKGARGINAVSIS